MDTSYRHDFLDEVSKRPCPSTSTVIGGGLVACRMANPKETVWLIHEFPLFHFAPPDAYQARERYTSVKCSLNMISCDPLLQHKIRRSAHALKQVQMEAGHLVKLHTFQYLENSLPPPDYTDKTFFDHCCLGVASTLQTRLIAEKSLVLSKKHPCVSQYGLVDVSNLTGYTQLKNELREQMVVNVGDEMIREHFESTFDSTCGSHLEGLVAVSPKANEEERKLKNAIMHACTSTDETNMTEVLQMRDIPTPDCTD